MTTREFIGAASRALGRSTPQAPAAPLVYRHSVHADVMQGLSQDALVKEFVDSSRLIGAHVVETTKSQLPASIVQAVKECPAGPVLVADDPLLRELGVVRLFKETPAQVWDVNGTWQANVAFAEKARIGIAVARLALAESGTVLLFSHAGTGRSVTLLPEATIYIIPKSLIRPRLTQGMAYVQEHQNDLPSCVNFVSGPSATSDIELVRVVGVHGPMHVVHIVVTDL